MSNENLIVVRSNKIEEGKRYLVNVHGVGQKWMVAKSVPTVPLSKMTDKDAFVFRSMNGRGEDLVLKTHGTGGPQFLIAKVTGKRGGVVNSRVTFFEKDKNVIAEPVKAKKAA